MSALPLDAPHRLLVDLCRRDALSRVTPGDLEALAPEDAWASFLELAGSHRLDGLVLSTLERLSKGSADFAAVVPGSRLAPLGLLRRQALGWDLEQSRVLAWLRKHDLEPVVLKGCALRHGYYRESAERPVSDLDLLFDPGHLDPARDRLAELGYVDPNSDATNALYRRHHFHVQLEHPGGFAIELHWGLTPPGPRGGLDPAEFLRGATPIEGARFPFQAASPEHTVLHLASQSAEGSMSRLGKIVDTDRLIAATADDFDWRALAEAARKGNLQNALGVTVSLAARLFGTPVPADFVGALGISRWSRRHLQAMDPIRWVLDQSALRYVAAGVVMRFWLESTAAARADVLLQACGLRPDPMRLLDQERQGAADSADPADVPSRSRIPAFLKIATYQSAVWFRFLKAPGGRAARAADFWG